MKERSMRTCKVCGIEKSLEDFPRDPSRKGGRGTTCKRCKADQAAEWRKQNPDYNTRYGRAYRKKDRQDIRTADPSKNYDVKRNHIDTIKQQCGCLFCGEAEPVCLSFHHIDPSIKLFGVSDFVSRTIEELDNEIAKCVVVCENCHRKLHAEIITLPN